MTRSQKRALPSALYQAARTLAAWLIMSGLIILLCLIP
jgi:hypothetical protein